MSEVRASLGPHRGDSRRHDEHSDLHARLARQSLARPLSELEATFADVLEDLYASGLADFEAVVRQLTERGVRAPRSRETTWSVALLESELQAINAALDEAYAGSGLST